jgi:hypothetical protein
MLGLRMGWMAAGLVAAMGLAGCADLADVPTGTCGNGVIDSDEDCDPGSNTSTSTNPTLATCGAPGGTGACQYICPQGTCPAGFYCGVDGLCRQPVSPESWSPGNPVSETSAQQILVADFDGDGVQDAVAVTTSGIDLHFFETTRTSTDTASILVLGPRPAVGTLTHAASSAASGSSDTFYPPSITFDLSDGLGVFTGGSDRTLTPIPYASLSTPVGSYHAVPFGFDKTLMAGLTEFFVYDLLGIDIYNPPAPKTSFVTFTLGDTRATDGVVARFDTSEVCDQIAMAFNSKPQGYVSVWSPCITAMPPLVAEVMLPVGTVCQALYLFDVDFDGNPDLVIVGVDNKVYVAYSNGTGQFAATSSGSYASMTTTVGPPLLTAPGGSPLAIGDLNGDCALDFVDASNIYTSYWMTSKPPASCNKTTAPSQPDGYASYTSPPGNQLWTEAHIADMNADGLLDVVVGSLLSPDVTIYRGTGTPLFNPLAIPTSAGTKSITIGDYDGDLVPDLAFADNGPTDAVTMATHDTVYVSFGARSGPPTTPVAIGQIDNVAEIFPATEQAVYGDLIQNPFVAANNAVTKATDVYLFAGNADRQVDAPYILLQATTNPGIDVPLRSVVGTFSTPTTTSSGDLATDIALYAKPTLCKGMGCGASRLWLLPTLGGAAITLASDQPVPPSTLPSDFTSASDALIANIGPSADGGFDQVVVAAPVMGATTTKVGLITATVSSGLFKMSTPEGYIDNFDISALTTGGAQLLVANVDGAGRLDAVLVSSGGIAAALWDGTTFTQVPPLTIMQLVKACPYWSGDTVSVAAFSADATTGKQALVAVAAGGAARVDYGNGAFTPTCLPTIKGGSAVAVGDFDGDGIEDIMVSQAEGLVVFYKNTDSPGGRPNLSAQAVVESSK